MGLRSYVESGRDMILTLIKVIAESTSFTTNHIYFSIFFCYRLHIIASFFSQ